MVSTKYFCQSCKKELEEDQKLCPYCGSEKRDIKVELREEIKIRESLRGRQKRKGFKKFMVEFLQGWFPNIITKDSKYGVDKVRIVNKEKDEYHETVKDLKTDKIIHDCHEKLSDHHK